MSSEDRQAGRVVGELNEALLEIKGSSETREIPVIALTAHAMSGDRKKALETGCDEFESKPVELPRLLEKIDRLLSG